MASISSSPLRFSPIALIVSPSTSTSAFHVRSAVTMVPFLMTLLTRPLPPSSLSRPPIPAFPGQTTLISVQEP